MKLRILGLIAVAVLFSGCAGAGDGFGGRWEGSSVVVTRDGRRVAPGTQEDFAARVQNRVFFAFDRSQLTEEAKEALKRQAKWLKVYDDAEVKVEGHCDERGTREYNLALGERRANAVKEYLVSRGVDADRIDTISYGKERPLVAGSNPRAWAKNRRGTTVVVEN